MTVLITAEELTAASEGPTPPCVLDVRWSLGAPDGRADHEAGHVPGAVYVDLPSELAGHGAPTDGRHPLPEIADLQDAARGWGLRDGQSVVAYDDVAGTAAARVWWLLRWAGVADVRLLDGGLGAWREAGLRLDTGPVDPDRGDVTLDAGHLPVIDADTAATFAADGVLLDVRAAERYRGEHEPIDPVAGHIPGAVSAPATDLIGDDGRFLPVHELAARFDAAGATGARPIAAYCGSGVTAAHAVLALAILDREAALFPGSFSAWCADSSRPVATGPEPGSPRG